MIPKNSMIMPVMGKPMITKTIPRAKQIVPRSFEGFIKNLRVFRVPINSVIPARNNMFPRASRARSKKVRTPKMRKMIPNTVSPVPISVEIKRIRYEGILTRA